MVAEPTVPLALVATDFTTPTIPEGWYHDDPYGVWTTGVEHLTVHIPYATDASFTNSFVMDGRGQTPVWQLPSSLNPNMELGVGVGVRTHEPNFHWWYHILPASGTYFPLTVGGALTDPLVLGLRRWFRFVLADDSVLFQSSENGLDWFTDHLLTETVSKAQVYTGAWAFAVTDNQTSGFVQFSSSPAETGGSGLTTTDLDSKLSDWLDTTTGTETHSAPLQTYTQLIGQTTGYAGTYSGITVSGDTLKAFLIALFGLAANALSILGFLQGLWPTGHTPSDHDASLEAHRAATEPEGETLPSYIEGEIEIVLSAVTDQTNEITQILAHGNGTEDVPTIVGESDWSNIFRFDVPADFYTIDITTTDLDATSEDVGGTQVWDHLGFCVPLTVDGLPEYGPRLAIGGQVIRTGRQMGGIILNGRRVLSGHVTAYQYQPA